jgi:transcriptional regulator with XRE-family HTH domain
VPPRSPTVRRRRLGAELRRLRESVGLTIEQVAQQLECSDSKISRIETGQVGATPRDVRDMLDIYGAMDQQRDGLVQLAREARQRGWWDRAYGDLPITALVDLENAAAFVRTYLGLLMPGLLQTEEYARTVLKAAYPDMADSEVDRRVELRLMRQSRLTRDDPLTLRVILDEGVLHRLVGGRQVMRQQLERLVEASELPNVSLQVLPFNAGAHPAMDGDFTIVGFPEPTDPDVVYLEHSLSDLYLEDVTAIRRYSLLFDALSSMALSPKESVATLAHKAKDL